MILHIKTIPEENLRKPSTRLTREELLLPETQQLIDDMIPTMYDDDGIGLAAPQVGTNLRICVIGKESDKKIDSDLVLVNPVWERQSKKTNVDTEGCLSVPETYGKVKRYSHIAVKAWDRQGTPIEFEAKNFFARVIQHEVDHLDGILFIDKATDMYMVDKDNRTQFIDEINKRKIPHF